MERSKRSKSECSDLDELCKSQRKYTAIFNKEEQKNAIFFSTHSDEGFGSFFFLSEET